MYTWRAWWCSLPLVLLCGFLALQHVKTLREAADQNASELARNVMTVVDQHIESQIAALQMLATSPLADNPDRWHQLYKEALGFQHHFGNHVILADLGQQMRFNTRVPFGAPLPLLPKPTGQGAVATLLKTGRPAVGDMFIGPIAKRPLVAIAVPVIREGQPRALLLCIIETEHLLDHLKTIILPQGWSLRLLDSTKTLLAERSSRSNDQQAPSEQREGKWQVSSAITPWSVLLDIDRDTYQRPVLVAGLSLLTALILAILLSFVIGQLTSRRLSRSLATLVGPEGQLDKPQKLIQEIEDLRQDLEASNIAREATETNLASSEQRFRRLFEATAIPLCFVSQDGIIQAINHCFTETFGYRHEDLPTLDQWWQQAYPDPDYRQRVIGTWQQAVEQAAAQKSAIEPFEYTVTCKNGEVRTAVISGSLLDEGFLATFFDVTKRKEVEKRLRESEALFRDLFQHHSAIKLIIDPVDGTIVDANESAVKFYGWPAEQLKGMKITQINQITPEEIHTRIDQIKQREQNRFEFQHHLADGSVHDVEVYSSAIVSQGRELLHSIVHDITERKRKETERERLLAAIQQAGESIFITDAKGAIQYVNPAFEAITGYKPQEVIGRFPSLLKSGKHDRAFYVDLWQTIARGKTWKGRIVNRRKDGSEYTEATTISPVRDAAGTIVNYVAVKRDISTTLLLEAQLQQAQKMESVGRLAGGVAHDYNNMLSVILGYSQLALEKVEPDSPLADNLHQILDAANRSAQITRQLLAFARKQAIIPKVLDLNETVEGMLKMLRRLLGEHIDLAWFPDASIWPVKIDPSQLDQILANLCVNARDSITGTGRISLETGTAILDADYCRDHPGFQPGEYAVLSVSDNGCGMDQPTIDLIFEPFFTTKKMGEGTGLGLSTVYGIVKQNNGFINVYSEPGKGSTFRIYLPRHGSGGAILALQQKKPVPQGRGQRILVVEDDRATLELTRNLLVGLNYQVQTANSPHDALQAVANQQSPFDLLITDVIMPDMNGRELANRLCESHTGMRCLFMSGYTADIIAHSNILEDGLHFLQKPFTKDSLATKVHEVLQD
jgi:PAS domain S-box-containing protein